MQNKINFVSKKKILREYPSEILLIFFFFVIVQNVSINLDFYYRTLWRVEEIFQFKLISKLKLNYLV